MVAAASVVVVVVVVIVVAVVVVATLDVDKAFAVVAMARIRNRRIIVNRWR